jgi:hypothetical protein
MSEGICEHDCEMLVRPSPFEFLTCIALASDKDLARCGIGHDHKAAQVDVQGL